MTKHPSPSKVVSIAIALCASILLFAGGCKQGDIQVINQVKTFEPQWANLREELGWLDRNLAKTESRFQNDIDEIRPLKNRITDTLAMRRFWWISKKYDGLIETRDSIREIFDAKKKLHSKAVEDFHAWEEKVTGGEVEKEAALKRLAEFKSVHTDIDTVTTHLKVRLESIALKHNEYLREMTGFVDVLTNYDIELN